jgi:integrase
LSHKNQQLETLQLKAIPQPIDSRIANTLITTQGNGLSINVVKEIGYRLRQLAKHSNLLDPEDVKRYISIATTNKTNRPIANETKNRYTYAYDKFCEASRIQWTKPFYKVEEKSPMIPTKENVTLIISNSGKRYATIFTILAEIGCAPHELENVTRNDIDTEQGIISIRGVKGHASGNYKLKKQTAEMLRVYLHHYQQEHAFSSSKEMSNIWRDTRLRTSKKLCKPELDKIPLKNLRNYSGAQLYLNSPVRDPIAVMRHLRHKKLETTMHYIRAIVLDAEEEYTCRTATTKEEAAALIEAGFMFVQTLGDTHLYRKRK